MSEAVCTRYVLRANLRQSVKKLCDRRLVGDSELALTTDPVTKDITANRRAIFPVLRLVLTAQMKIYREMFQKYYDYDVLRVGLLLDFGNVESRT